MLSVEQHAKIRQMFFLEQLSARQIAQQLGVSRNTVASALRSEQAPGYTLQQPRPKPKLGEFQTTIEQLLLENNRLPKKQRYTSHKIFELIQAQGYSGSYSSVNLYVVQWRKKHKVPKVFLPLEFEPGQEAQVDWYEARVYLAGLLTTVQVFVMWLCYSRRIFVRAFPAQKQEAFFEGHLKAFEFFGGVPHRLSYDNLAAAVRVLADGRTREESRAFTAFKSYYLFESHFCTPGQGHEKGGVEASAGFSRRNFLVPLPRVESFEELNQQLLARCQANDARQVARQTRPIGQMWEEERSLLRPLPLRPFECCVRRQVRLNGYSQVTFETNRYSVPVEQARQELVLKAYPFRIDILLPTPPAGATSAVIASHPRCYGHEQDLFNPLHYLALLEQRPGAFEYAKPLKQWKAQWPQVYQRVLERLETQWPGGRGVKEFVRILKLHQTYQVEQLERALHKALEWGCVHYDGVLQALHQTQQPLRQLSFGELDLAGKPELAEIANRPVDLSRYNKLLAFPSLRSPDPASVSPERQAAREVAR